MYCGQNIKKNVLVVSTVASTVDQFCMNDISILQDLYNVSVAANFSYGNNTSEDRVKQFVNELNEKKINVLNIEIDRKPFSLKNFVALRKIKEILKMNKYDIIHCHTPIAAMIVRLAAKKYRKLGTKVIYTAHGFHFYKGATFTNWLVYFPVEWWLSKYTDVLITINNEDYNRAKKILKAKKNKYIPGIGVDLNKFKKNNYIEKMNIREELGIPESGFVMLSVGELNKNKNHETIITSLYKVNNPNIYYIICGQGALDYYLKNLINSLNLQNNVKLLGYRNDINAICSDSDLFVFPSYREGLSVALMEAMATGLPVLCSNIRGNSDLIENEKGGYLVNPDDIDSFSNYINVFYNSAELRNKFSKCNLDKIEYYSSENVINEMRKLYMDIK